LEILHTKIQDFPEGVATL